MFAQYITGNVVRVLIQRHANGSLHTGCIQECSCSENLLAAQAGVMLKQTGNDVTWIRNIDQDSMETGFFQGRSDLFSLPAVERVFQEAISAFGQGLDVSERCNDNIRILESLIVVHGKLCIGIQAA